MDSDSRFTSSEFTVCAVSRDRYALFIIGAPKRRTCTDVKEHGAVPDFRYAAEADRHLQGTQEPD